MQDQLRRIYEFGPFHLDANERLLLRDGQPLALMPKAFDTLLLLVENSGRLLEKEELMRSVWPDTVVEENSLNRSISILRKTLGESSGQAKYIETVPKHGYRFLASVAELNGDEPDLILEKHTSTEIITEEEEITESGKAELDDSFDREPLTIGAASKINFISALRRHSVAVLGTVAVTALAALIYLWTTTRPGPAPSAAKVKSIAVLPFKNLGASGDDEHLGLGVTDTLITHLSSLREVVVRPTSAIIKYEGVEQDAVVAGRALRVDAVLEGSLQTVGNRIRVTVRLISSEDGSPIWAAKFDEKLENMLAVQDSMAEHVAGALSLNVTGVEKEHLTKHYTEDAEAYRLYSKGRYFWNKRTEEGLNKAIGYFLQAIDRDQNYALAYAGLADCYALLTYHSQIPREETFAKATAAATKALGIDDNIAEAHVSLGFIHAAYDWDMSAAEREYKRAIALNPNYATAHHWYAFCLLVLGRANEGIAVMKRAQEIDPLSVVIQADLAWAFYFMREYDQAVEQHLKAIEMDPSFAPAHNQLGQVYQQKGLLAEAIREIQIAMRLFGNSSDATTAMEALACTYGLLGKQDEARKIIVLLKRVPAKNSVSIAAIYAGLGDKDQAFDWLERAYKERIPTMLDVKINPVWDSLRPDPRYGDLLRRMHFL